MPPKYNARGKPLLPRPSSEPAWLQEIHGNSLFLSRQKDSYVAEEEEEEQEEAREGEEEEGLLVIQVDGGENLEENTFPPPGVLATTLQILATERY